MKKYSDKERRDLLDVRIFFRKRNDILEDIEKYLKKVKSQSVKPFVIFTPNPEIIVYAQKNDYFRQILNRADMTLPDGIGVVWAARILKNQQSRIKNKKIKERISGVEFMADLVKLASKKGLTIGLIGGKQNVAVKALECLKRKYSSLKGWAMEGPEMEIKSEKLEVQSKKNYYPPNTNFLVEKKGEMSIDKLFALIEEKIDHTHTYIVFVGLGCPKQEYFIDELSRRIVRAGYNRPIVLMAVGGAFDTISGRIRRAPFFMRKMGLEWLYRLVRQPWRIKRQLALFEFSWLVGREYLKLAVRERKSA